MGHVRLFSPWHSNIDAAAAGLLIDAGWTVPDLDTLPTGRELVDDYLMPLGEVPELAGRIRLGARVTAIGRSVDKVDHDRRTAPFAIRYTTADGEREVQVISVIDASGTWLTPNPLGANDCPLGARTRYATGCTTAFRRRTRLEPGPLPRADHGGRRLRPLGRERHPRVVGAAA